MEYVEITNVRDPIPAMIRDELSEWLDVTPKQLSKLEHSIKTKTVEIRTREDPEYKLIVKF